MSEKRQFAIDLRKPLVHQVGHLGEEYYEWVHQPIISKEGPRFFESDLFEFFTKTAWWAIPVIWLPIAGFSIFKSYQMGHSVAEVALMVLSGIFSWSLQEYILHRFLFHFQTKSFWGNTIHYVLHGFHHKHPMDGPRLVFPPAATALICIPLWNLVKLLSTPTSSPAVFGGGLLGYVMYDLTHYYLHHGQPSSQLARTLRKYHMNHHFRIQNMGFGVTTSLWDWVFGTLPQANGATNYSHNLKS